MSYILDALRKSQRDRETTSDDRQAESTHLVAAALQRTRRLFWGGVLLLVINLGVAGTVWWHARAGGASAKDSLAPAELPAGHAQPSRPVLEQKAAPPPVVVAVDAPPQPTAAGRDIEAEFRFESDRHAAALAQQDQPSFSQSGRPRQAEATALSTVEDAAAPAPSAVAGVAANTSAEPDESVPVYMEADMTLWRRFPSLRLDVHVYSPRPEERFVYINTKKYREGDSTAEGLHVDAISAEGVVLSYEGQPFRLLPQ